MRRTASEALHDLRLRVARLERRASYKDILIDVMEEYASELEEAMGVSDLSESPVYDDIGSGDIASAYAKSRSPRVKHALVRFLAALISALATSAQKRALDTIVTKMLASRANLLKLDLSVLPLDKAERELLTEWEGYGIAEFTPFDGVFLTDLGYHYVNESLKP